ncbi:hypothetical protein FB565_008334 [Actinoplanes lutulentus]|uniref:Peptidase YpeB-like protein n=1 Tax=Actinoplanes lutulentus TaxID=1287878 RepID=A0A327Z8C9_9ACTN|nr:PepSY domain-containing protein [Actinoplanes lutulentus]MBB2948551.1 hypothetical protein [Actinoplanes lutulentus]RAK34417.1 peptidase YpeB-like protein [Actinoplanes lutulentus]
MITKTQAAVVFAAGTIAALGITGTAMAMDTPSPSVSTTTVGPSTSGSASTSGSGSPAVPGSSAGTGSSAGAGSSAGSGSEITEARAREIALAAVSGGKIEEIERDKENGREVWDVEVQAGTAEHDLDIDATTGEILRNDAEQDEADDASDTDDADDADDRDDDGDDD